MDSDAWGDTPSPASVDRGPLPVAPLNRRSGPRRRSAGTGLVAASLAVAIVANGVGILATILGVFCVAFITAFGAPLEVTRPAMAGFAVRGSAVTAAVLVVALVLLVIGIVVQERSKWWIAPAIVNAATVFGLVVAALIWYHPGHHVSWDFSS
jgi:hypothetical protein